MTDKNFWIGADDVITEGTFQWIDGSPVAMGAPFWSSVSKQIIISSGNFMYILTH